MREQSGTGDVLEAHVAALRERGDVAGWVGSIHAVLFDAEQRRIYELIAHNRITTYGDEWATRRCVGTTPGIVTGMRLGTGTTAPSKSGAGAAIVTYVAGSSRVLDGAATVAAIGTDVGWRASHVVTWPAGTATANAISEVAITNATITDVAGTAADTIARVLLSPTVNKGASDTLAVTWRLDHVGP